MALIKTCRADESHPALALSTNTSPLWGPLRKAPMANRITTLQRYPRLSSGTLHGKRDCADVVKLKVLGCGEDPDMSGWAHYHHEGPRKREAGWLELLGDLKRLHCWF